MDSDQISAPTITTRPDRHLLRAEGSNRYLVCSVQAPLRTDLQTEQRQPLAIALVIDRSGSMSGDKVEMAKSAALAVIEQLTEKDRVAVVIYDDKIDVVQSSAYVTSELRRSLRNRIGSISARGSTALHEGWLRGCDAIASEHVKSTDAIARCFLLTDGLANIGETNVDVISSDALRVRRDAFVGTTTFGIGSDYDENLLMSMAIAGSGQFYHLRTTADFVPAFTGELGDLFAVVASHAILEISAPDCDDIEIIGAYRLESTAQKMYRIELGDLPSGSLREVACRIHFPKQTMQEQCTVHVNLYWKDSDGHEQSRGTTTVFRYAGDAANEEESADKAVIRLIGREQVERTRRSTYTLNKTGMYADAVAQVHEVIADLEAYDDDPEIRKLMTELQQLQVDVAAPIHPMAMKEQFYQSQRTSRGQTEHRPQDK